MLFCFGFVGLKHLSFVLQVEGCSGGGKVHRAVTRTRVCCGASRKELTRGEAGDVLLVALHHFAACSVTSLPQDIGCHI